MCRLVKGYVRGYLLWHLFYGVDLEAIWDSIPAKWMVKRGGYASWRTVRQFEVVG